jgi:hypothetical protein
LNRAGNLRLGGDFSLAQSFDLALPQTVDPIQQTRGDSCHGDVDLLLECSRGSNDVLERGRELRRRCKASLRCFTLCRVSKRLAQILQTVPESHQLLPQLFDDGRILGGDKAPAVCPHIRERVIRDTRSRDLVQ